MEELTKDIALKRASLEKYFGGLFGPCMVRGPKRLGGGVHGSGFMVEVEAEGKTVPFVLKAVRPEGFGHEYPSDRAGMFLLALETYRGLPGHVRAVDVLSVNEGGEIMPIGGGREYFLLIEYAEGESYFRDLEGFSSKKALEEMDGKRIIAMADYLSEIHSVKKDSKTLYLRRLRDVIGHGECLMGVFDTYPEGVLSPEEMAEIEKKCIDWRAALKGNSKRLSQVHGDFHPGNIWFKPGSTNFILLDRSRGPWGEPGDDLTALAINYVFFSIKHHDIVDGAYLDGLKTFFGRYLEKTGDSEVMGVLAPFFAFRGAVVANPVFYPELNPAQREMILGFVRGVLESREFSPEKVNEYML